MNAYCDLQFDNRPDFFLFWSEANSRIIAKIWTRFEIRWWYYISFYFLILIILWLCKKMSLLFKKTLDFLEIKRHPLCDAFSSDLEKLCASIWRVQWEGERKIRGWRKRKRLGKSVQMFFVSILPNFCKCEIILKYSKLIVKKISYGNQEIQF